MDKETDDLIQEYVAEGGDFRDWLPRYSIAPTNTVPIIREMIVDDHVVRSVDAAGWDFPRSPYSTVRGPSINAKREKLTTTWKASFASRRCIVPMIGYYEWTGPPGSKQPHFIHQRGEDGGPALLSAAGMYATADDGTLRCVVITDEGRDASGELHDRMPVFLTEDLWDAWLDPESLTPPNRQQAVVAAHRERKEHLLASLVTSSAEISPTITAYMVDKRVNNVKAIDPTDATLIQPLPSEPRTLF